MKNMSERPSGRRLWLWLTAAFALYALAAISLWLNADPGRAPIAAALALFFTGLSGFTGILAAIFAWQALYRSQGAPEKPVERYREELAETVRGEIGDEIETLKLADTDYIEVEWSIHPRFSTPEGTQRYSGPDTNLRESEPRGVSTLAEDWSEHHTQLTMVLGGKGAGKSTVAMLLAHQLLAQRNVRDPDSPVPVLLRIGEWNPDDDNDLQRWISTQMTHRYRMPVPGQRSDRIDVAQQMMSQGLLILVLDGFDEIAESRAKDALGALRAMMTKYPCPIVLTSRLDEFTNAMSIFGDRLAASTAVTLRPVEWSKAATFLKKGHQDKGHWDAVIEQLRKPDSPMAKALETPLMVFLCRETYKSAETGPTRTELEAFADQRSVERHLIERFIPSRYAGGLTLSGRRYKAEDALRWLSYLSVHMDRLSTTQFEWWRLAPSKPDSDDGSTIVPPRLTFQPRTAIAGLADGLSGRLKVGLESVLTVLAIGLGIGLVMGLTGGLALGLTFGLTFGLAFGLAIGLAEVLGFGLKAGLTAGMEGKHTRSELQVLTPRQTLGSARSAEILIRLTVGLAGGLVIGLAIGVGAELTFGRAIGLAAGLTFGVVIGVVIGVGVGLEVDIRSGWTNYRSANLRLARRGSKLPWPLMDFLEDSHQRGVLRRAGAAYEFRHGVLQQYLVERAVTNHALTKVFRTYYRARKSDEQNRLR